MEESSVAVLPSDDKQDNVINEVCAALGVITLTNKPEGEKEKTHLTQGNSVEQDDKQKVSENASTLGILSNEGIEQLQLEKVFKEDVVQLCESQKDSHNGGKTEDNIEVDADGNLNDKHIEQIKLKNPVEKYEVQSIELEKESENGEKVEENIGHDTSHSDELLKEKITVVEKDIVNDVTQPNEINEIDVKVKEKELRVIIELLECPFTMNLEYSDFIFSKTFVKIKEIEGESSFCWRHFILTLVLCCVYYKKKDFDSAFVELRRCEAIINNPEPETKFGNIFQTLRNALLHILLSCKCYLYLEKGDLKAVEEILNCICKVEEMDSHCKAAIWGVKAAVAMENGYEGNKV